MPGQPEPKDSGFLKIKKISWLDRQRLHPRNPALTERLAAWNQELWSPERILEALGLVEADLGLLRVLGGRLEGWHPFKFDAGAGLEAGGLAALGLVRVGRLLRRVRLTGAGRVLLLLTDIDPTIKKGPAPAKAGLRKD
jgi:hypothetical protein